MNNVLVSGASGIVATRILISLDYFPSIQQFGRTLPPRIAAPSSL